VHAATIANAANTIATSFLRSAFAITALNNITFAYHGIVHHPRIRQASPSAVSWPPPNSFCTITQGVNSDRR